jgi:hypothetical protein
VSVKEHLKEFFTICEICTFHEFCVDFKITDFYMGKYDEKQNEKPKKKIEGTFSRPLKELSDAKNGNYRYEFTDFENSKMFHPDFWRWDPYYYKDNEVKLICKNEIYYVIVKKYWNLNKFKIIEIGTI